VTAFEDRLAAVDARLTRFRTVTFDALRAGGRAELAITVEPETGVVTACTMQAPERVAPIEGWQDG
jgi:hypothetical protein